MIKYTVRAWFDEKIKIVEIDRETEKFIWIKGGRQTAKTSTGEWYRDTPQEAKQCLVNYRKQELEIAKRRLASAGRDVENAQERITEAEALELPQGKGE